MVQICQICCRHCGVQLTNRSVPDCPPCNLYLCYRAMPILLGMRMTGHLPLNLQPCRAQSPSARAPTKRGYDDKSLLLWE
jgi:hypothetical protein